MKLGSISIKWNTILCKKFKLLQEGINKMVRVEIVWKNILRGKEGMVQ